jgi:hypothetical protein
VDKFFALLTDLSFRRVGTPQLVKFLYVFTLVLSVIQVVLTILGGFARGPVAGLISLIVAPIVALFLICVIRVALEAAVSLYRSTGYLAELARAQRPTPPGGGMEPEPEPEEPLSRPASKRATVVDKSGF